LRFVICSINIWVLKQSEQCWTNRTNGYNNQSTSNYSFS